MRRAAANPRKKRKWLRFSLRSLLILIALFAILFAVIGGDIGKAYRQARDMKYLQEEGFQIVEYSQPSQYEEMLLWFLPREGVLSPKEGRYGLKGANTEMLEIISRQTSWEDLRLVVDPADRDILRRRIQNWRGLEGLSIDNALGGDALPSLANHQDLYSLSISVEGCDASVYTSIAAAPALEYIHLGSVFDEGLVNVLEMPTLRELALSGQNFTSAPFVAARTSSIEKLYVPVTKFDNQALKAVLKWPRLKHLIVGDTLITDEVFAEIPLQDKQRLETLSWRNGPITSAAIPGIAEFSSLVTLGLSNTKITDENLELLNQMPALEELNLMYCQLTDAGVSKLRNPSITKLWLSDTQITVAALENLDQRFPALQACGIEWCKITAAEVETLRAKFPTVSFNDLPAKQPLPFEWDE